jgi:hypothetical protein
LNVKPPPRYEDLIELQSGTPAAAGPPPVAATPPGFDPALTLRPGWQDQFGAVQKYWRCVGINDVLLRNGMSMARLAGDKSIKTRALELVPNSWHDQYFDTHTWSEFGDDQFKLAAAGNLQRFDKAAQSILFVHAALEQARFDFPVYYFCRLRPILYYIEGFDRHYYERIAGNELRRSTLRDKVGQPAKDLFEELSDGLTFVSRKTAELTLSTLRALDPSGTAGFSVQIAWNRKRPGRMKTVWPSKVERIHYNENEYLSASGFGALTPVQAAIVASEPVPRVSRFLPDPACVW